MSVSVFFTARPAPRLHSTEPLTDYRTLKLEYLNEGGANFVFKFLPEGDEQYLSEHLQGKLLRLRKDLPHVQSANEQLEAFNAHFKPLFPLENLIEHELIELDGGIPAVFNSALGKLNRPSHRLQDFLPQDESHGLLVTDMMPALGDVLLQVKPKWLAQSPNAPSGAKRCRTCALRAQRASQKVRTATDAQESCPLELISEKADERKRAAQAVTVDRRLQDYLTTTAQPLLQKLRESQLQLDSKGILNTSTTAEIMGVCKAMTLRDCTLFLKRSGNYVEARLADLDLKQPEKLSRWKKVEQDLTNHGWYTNSEDDVLWRQEVVCLLSR